MVSVSLHTYAFEPPGVPFSFTTQQKLDATKISTYTLDLADYPEGNEVCGIRGDVSGTHGQYTVYVKFYEDGTDRLLWSGSWSTGSGNFSASWFEFWIGHAAWEISNNMTVRAEVTMTGDVQKTQTLYIEVENTAAPVVSDEIYELKISMPLDVNAYIATHWTAIKSKLEAAMLAFGWSYDSAYRTPDDFNIRFKETGSITVGALALIIIGILSAIVALVYGWVKFSWRVVKTSNDETIQQAIESKDSTLQILKDIRDDLAEKGLDTGEIDQAIIDLAGEDVEIPETDDGTSTGSVDWVLIAALAAVALAVSNK